jgi:hypothetical protein
MKSHPSTSSCAQTYFFYATWFCKCAIVFAFIASLCLSQGCESKYQDNWGKVHTGMTKQEVEALLGPPSSKYDAKEVDGEVVVAEDRWQYGDNLSTLATGALFPSQAHPHAWAISFGPSGRVSQIQAADSDN